MDEERERMPDSFYLVRLSNVAIKSLQGLSKRMLSL
jgi:hypothetical protein